MKVEKKALLQQLPPEWPEDVLPFIQKEIAKSGRKLVVLDDDPTGTQTVRNITVITRWDVDTLISVLNEPDVTVYILTNSRSLSKEVAKELNSEIAINLIKASELTGRDFSVVSRSDSTLRGYFPDEVYALLEGLGQNIDGILVAPFFEEGERLTIGNIHYVGEGDWLIPAAETEYAQDTTFGYSNSNLRDWVCEKYQTQIQPEEVISINLDTIRLAGPLGVANVLRCLKNEQVCIVNAACYRDMDVFVAGLLQEESAGKRFICRTAASFVRVRSGLGKAGLLSASEMGFGEGRHGGLIVAGSYIRKSTEQITAVQQLAELTSFEVSVPRLLDGTTYAEEIQRVSFAVESHLGQNKDVLVYTSREFVKGTDSQASIHIGKLVSTALVEIVQNIRIRPTWMIGKGGITSSDVATRGLGIWRAEVMGQILPGVPVWRLGEGCRWPGLVYVVFPGNVGGPYAIVEAIHRLCDTK
jgi:uncharacterized protein YgbK (DUF1537 family)